MAMARPRPALALHYLLLADHRPAKPERPGRTGLDVGVSEVLQPEVEDGIGAMDDPYQTFMQYLKLSDDLIEQSSKDLLAETARVLA